MKYKFRLLAVAAAMAAASIAQAATFKWSSASDIPTLDIHSQNNALGNGVHAAIYDALTLPPPLRLDARLPTPTLVARVLAVLAACRTRTDAGPGAPPTRL